MLNQLKYFEITSLSLDINLVISLSYQMKIYSFCITHFIKIIIKYFKFLKTIKLLNYLLNKKQNFFQFVVETDII